MSYAPEPSPAPTLAGVPGYFPPTPDLESSHSSAQDPFSSSTESTTAETQDYDHKVNNAAGVLLGAAAGFVVGGPAGAIVGGSLVGVGEFENDGIVEQQHHAHPENAPSTTTTENKSIEQPFDEQKENSQAALEDSPAQNLIAPSSKGDNEEEGSKLTGAGAIGGALLAGGAGAKVLDNEVEQPVHEDNSLTPTTTRTEEESSTQPVAPDFGTPAVEKEQAALATSPAQRLLGSRTDSTVGAENVLLAGGTGAHVADREVEEPETDLPKDVPGGSGAVLETGTSEPLERQISSVPAPAPMTPRPAMDTQGSTTSFAAAVLAAGTGIDTPTREEVPLSMSGSTGVHPLVRASDEGPDDVASIKTTTPASVGTSPSSVDATPRSYPNVLPTVFPALGAVAAAPVVADESKEIPSEVSPQKQEEEVVHNPPPVLATNLPVESNATDRPEDFQPYTPPAVPEQEREQDDMAEDKGKGKAPEVLLATVATGAGAGVLAHELKEKRSIDSDRPSSQPGSVFQENFTPAPQLVEQDPLALENQRAIPPQQAQGDPVLVLPVLDKGKGRAIDPEDLHNVPETSIEQAGFAPGSANTVAAQEFAHLSQPAPQAELAAQREADQPVVPATSTVPPQHNNAVVPAVIGAGAAVPLIVNNSGINSATAHPIAVPTSQGVSTPAPVAPVNPTPPVTQQQPVAAATPVRSAVAQPTPVPVQHQQPVPVQQQPVQPTPVSNVARSQSPHGLAEGVERSPHMHIQTHHDESGKKKLHRKSLAADRKPLTFGVGVTKASKPDKSIENEGRRDRLMDGWSGVPDPTVQRQQPAVVPQQQPQGIAHPQQQFAQAPPPQQQRGPIVAQQVPIGGQQQQQQPAVRYQQSPQFAPPRTAAVTNSGAVTPVPVGTAPPHAHPGHPSHASNPSSPTASSPGHNDTVHRKLSKSRPRSKSNASGNASDREKSGGFLSKVFGRHSRSGSGSVDGGSPRASTELQRPPPTA